jgi:hypothetical protein
MLKPASLLGPLAALAFVSASLSANAAAPPWAGPEALIPADAPVVVMSRAPGELLDRVGYAKLVGKHAWIFDKARAAVTEEFGADLLSEAGWKSWGLDLRRPAALVCLDLSRDLWVVWVAVADAGVFEATVTRNPVALPIVVKF